MTGGSSIREYAEHWLKRVKVTRKPRTHRTYECILRGHLLPEFGETRLHDLKCSAVKAYVPRTLGEGGEGCEGTLYFRMRVFSAVLNAAIDDDLIETNPTLHIARQLGMRARADNQRA